MDSKAQLNCFGMSKFLILQYVFCITFYVSVYCCWLASTFWTLGNETKRIV